MSPSPASSLRQRLTGVMPPITMPFDVEYEAVMREAYEATHGRVPFVAGLIVQSTRDAISRPHRLQGLNIEALQVTPVHYLFEPRAPMMRVSDEQKTAIKKTL